MGIAGLRINSIFTYIGAIFIVALIGLNSMTFGVVRYFKSIAEYQEHQSEVKALRIIEESDEPLDELNKRLVLLGVRKIEPTEQVLDGAKEVERFEFGKSLERDGLYYSYYYRLPPPVKPSFPIPLVGDFFEKLQTQNDKKPKPANSFSSPILLQKLDYRPNDYAFLLWLAPVALNILIGVIFWLVIRKLYPILHLRETIKRFGLGDLSARAKISGSDEIAFVGAEFDKTADLVNELLEARALLIRNLLHELKTPVTTAKLTAAVVREERLKKRLDVAFCRIESVIDRSVWMEKLASGLLKLTPLECDIGECVNEASNLLFSADRVELSGRGVCECDRELIVIAIKNLIDNALKYSTENEKISVKVSDFYIEVKNEAGALDMAFESYLIPFSRSYESKKGLGLGLWIVSRIAKLHNGEFGYRHEDGSNIFFLRLGSLTLNPR